MADTTLNTKPIYSAKPSIAWGEIATANTAKDGTGTVVTIFTAGASGGRIERIKVRSKGTNSTSSVLRVWINNGSTNATPANNTLFVEQTLATTVLSETLALADIEILMNIALPAGYKINVTVGTTGAAGWHVTGIGGQYVE